MNYARFNTIVIAGWSGDDGAGGDDGVDDDDDDPDEVQLDGGVDGDDLPSPGRNSLNRNLSAREIFLSRCFPPRRGGGIFLWSLPESYGFVGMIYAGGERLEWARVATPPPGAA